MPSFSSLSKSKGSNRPVLNASALGQPSIDANALKNAKWLVYLATNERVVFLEMKDDLATADKFELVLSKSHHFRASKIATGESIIEYINSHQGSMFIEASNKIIKIHLD